MLWCLIVLSLIWSSFSLALFSIMPRSMTGITALINPMLTSFSYRCLTVGVLTPISLEICLKDFLPSLRRDSSTAISVSSNRNGMTKITPHPCISCTLYNCKVLELSKCQWYMMSYDCRGRQARRKEQAHRDKNRRYALCRMCQLYTEIYFRGTRSK